MEKIKVGDIVKFKSVRKITLEDLIARKDYSKYMLVVEIIRNYENTRKPLAACKVLCSNGEVNWVGINCLEQSGWNKHGVIYKESLLIVIQVEFLKLFNYWCFKSFFIIINVYKMRF